jgi:predicted helicase
MCTGESHIDELFERMYGVKTKKKGTAYELLVAAAFKLLQANSQVRANQHVQGTYSEEQYRIDVAIESLKTFVEAKDYTQKGKKVGRPDVSKLAGALLDLPFKSGVVASATDFSRPARKYAQATKVNPSSKPIDLYHVRPSVEEDEEGRIRRVRVNISLLALDPRNMKFEPEITKQGNEVLKQLYNVGDSVQLRLEEIHRSDGSVLITIHELTS